MWTQYFLHSGGRFKVKVPHFQHMNSNYRYKTVLRQFNLYDINLHTWKDYIDIETAPGDRA